MIALVGGALLLLRRAPNLATAVGRVGRFAVPVIVAVLTVRGVLEIWDDAQLIID